MWQTLKRFLCFDPVSAFVLSKYAIDQKSHAELLNLLGSQKGTIHLDDNFFQTKYVFGAWSKNVIDYVKAYRWCPYLGYCKNYPLLGFHCLLLAF